MINKKDNEQFLPELFAENNSDLQNLIISLNHLFNNRSSSNQMSFEIFGVYDINNITFDQVSNVKENIEIQVYKYFKHIVNYVSAEIDEESETLSLTFNLKNSNKNITIEKKL